MFQNYVEFHEIVYPMTKEMARPEPKNWELLQVRKGSSLSDRPIDDGTIHGYWEKDEKKLWNN